MMHVVGCGRAESNHENDARGGASGMAGASGTGALANHPSGGSMNDGGATSTGGTTSMTGGTTSISGGTTSMTGGTTSMNAGASGRMPTQNDAGASGSGPHTTDPLVLCGDSYPIYCSEEAACEKLGCGKPWSGIDAKGCYHSNDCSFGRTCAEGLRCVPAVLTDFTQSCFADTDMCEDSSGTCTCFTSGCYPREVCVDANEFAPGEECKLEGLLCNDLQLAQQNIDAYIQSQFEEESGPMSKQAKAMVDACRARVIDSIFLLCP